MNQETQKQKNQAVGQEPAIGREPWTAPRLIVHGSVEALTKGKGLLLKDAIVGGSGVSTVSVLG